MSYIVLWKCLLSFIKSIQKDKQVNLYFQYCALKLKILVKSLSSFLGLAEFKPLANSAVIIRPIVNRKGSNKIILEYFRLERIIYESIIN